MGQKQKNEKTEGATGLGSITREQIEKEKKRNQMTAMRFQKGGGHQKRSASLRALFGEVLEKVK